MLDVRPAPDGPVEILPQIIGRRQFRDVEEVYRQILKRVSGSNSDWVEARLANTPDSLKRRLENVAE